MHRASTGQQSFVALTEHPIFMLLHHMNSSVRVVSARGHSSRLALKVPRHSCNCHGPRWNPYSVKSSETCVRVTKGQSETAETGPSEVRKQQSQPYSATTCPYVCGNRSAGPDVTDDLCDSDQSHRLPFLAISGAGRKTTTNFVTEM